MITGFKKDGIIYYHNIPDSKILDYIEGEPTASVIQRICVEKLGTYDTSNVTALRVEKNKWIVIKKGD